MLDIKTSADYLSRTGTFTNFSMLFAGKNVKLVSFRAHWFLRYFSIKFGVEYLIWILVLFYLILSNFNFNHLNTCTGLNCPIFSVCYICFSNFLFIYAFIIPSYCRPLAFTQSIYMTFPPHHIVSMLVSWSVLSTTSFSCNLVLFVLSNCI